jgi:hypothetical protein
MFTIQEQTKLANGGYPLEWGTGVTFTNGSAPLSTYKTLVNLSGTISVAALDMRPNNKRTALVTAVATAGATTVQVDNVIGFTSSTFLRTPVSVTNFSLIQIGARIYKQVGYAITAPGGYAGTITLDASTPIVSTDGAIGRIVVPAAHTMWMREMNGTAGFENTIALNLIGDKLIRFNGTNGNLEFVNLVAGLAPSANVNINIPTGSISGSGNASFTGVIAGGSGYGSSGIYTSGKALFDARLASTNTGSNALWLADGQTVAFNTAGTAQAKWNPTGSQVELSAPLQVQSLVTPSAFKSWTGLTYGTATCPVYSITQLNGTSGATAFSDIYRIVIADDMASPNGLLNGVGITHNIGAASTNYRSALSVNANVFATTGNKAAGINPIQVAGTIVAQASANDGGTAATQAGSWTSLIGFNGGAILYPGATNWAGAAAAEFDVAVAAGASAWRKRGILLVQTSVDAVQGVIDTGFVFSNQAGASGWKDLISIGDVASNWPLSSGGNLLVCRIGQGGVVGTTNRGIDLLESTFTSHAFRSRGFSVDGSGNTSIGPSVLVNDTNGLTLDAKGSTGTAVIASGGTGYAVGDVLYDSVGGVYTALGVSAGVISTFTTVRAPIGVAASLPSNPVALTGNALCVGSGATITITWTAKPVLSLNPTGAKILMSGVQASTTYANDAAAATGGVAVGQLYRNGSVVQIRIS